MTHHEHYVLSASPPYVARRSATRLGRWVVDSRKEHQTLAVCNDKNTAEWIAYCLNKMESQR